MKSAFMQMKRFPGTSRKSIRGPRECSGLANLLRKLHTFEEQDQQKIMQTCQQDCRGSRWDLWFYDLDNSEAASPEVHHSAACFITSRALLEIPDQKNFGENALWKSVSSSLKLGGHVFLEERDRKVLLFQQRQPPMAFTSPSLAFAVHLIIFLDGH